MATIPVISPVGRWLRRHPILSALVLLVLVVAAFVSAYFWAHRQLQLATDAVQVRNLDLARKHLDRYKSVWGWRRDPDVYLLAARIERLDDNHKNAEDLLALSKKLRGDVTKDHQLEARLLHAASGGFAKDKSGLQNFVKNHPNDKQTPYVLEGLARGCMHGKRYYEAEKWLNQWLELDSENPRALFWRAFTRLQLRSEEDAKIDYRRSIKLGPWNWKARLDFVKLLQQNNAGAEAAEHVEILRRDHADHPDVQLAYARQLFHNLKYDEARTVLGGLAKADPKNADVAFAMARLELQSGNNVAAEQWARKATATRYSDVNAQFLLYRALNSQGKKEEAKRQEDVHDKVKALSDRLSDLIVLELRRRPGNVDVMVEIGAHYIDLKWPDLGVVWLQSALNKDPNHVEANSRMADYYESINQPEAAKPFRRRAAQNKE